MVLLAFGQRAVTDWSLSAFIKGFYKNLFMICCSVTQSFLVFLVKHVGHVMTCGLYSKWPYMFFLKITHNSLSPNFRNFSVGTIEVVYSSYSSVTSLHSRRC